MANLLDDDQMNDMLKQDDSQLTASVQLGLQQKNPEQFGKDLTVADRMGLPVETVQRQRESPDFISPERVNAAKSAINDVTLDFPQTKQFMSDPNNVALSSDDPGRWGRVARWASNAPGSEAMSGFIQTVRDLPQAVQISSDTTDLINLRTKQMYEGNLTPEEDARATAISDTLQHSSTELGGKGWMSQGIMQTALMSHQIGRIFAKGGAAAMVGAGAGAMGTGALGLVPGFEEAPALGPEVASATGKFLGSAGMAMEAYQQVSALTYDQLLRVRDDQGRGLDPNVMRGAAITVGALSAPLNTFGLEHMAETFPGVAALKNAITNNGIAAVVKAPGMAELLKDIGIKYAKGVTAQTAAMVGQGVATIGGTEAAKKLSNGNFTPATPGEIISEIGQYAKTGLQMSTVTGAVGSLARVGIEGRKIGQFTPDQVKAQIDDIHGNLADKNSDISKLFQNNEDRAHKFLSTLAPNDKLYLDAQTALNTVAQMPEETRQALFAAKPDLHLELARAASTNADIAMSKADYIRYIGKYVAGTPLADELSRNIKLDPADRSVAERDALQQALQNNPGLQKLVQDEAARKLPEAPQEGYATVERIVRKAMTDAQRPAPEVKAVAPFYAKFLTRQATAAGIDPIEHLGKNYLAFENQGPGGEVLSHGSNIGVMLRDYAKVKEGKPVPGVDQRGRQAIMDFGTRLEGSGLSTVEALTMPAKALHERLFPQEQPSGAAPETTTLNQPEEGNGIMGMLHNVASSLGFGVQSEEKVNNEQAVQNTPAGAERPAPEHSLRHGALQGRDTGGASGPYTRQAGRHVDGLGLTGSPHVLSPEAAESISEAGGTPTSFVDVTGDEHAPQTYRDLMVKAVSKTPYGKAVEIKSVEDLKSMRLFLNEDGTAGFALKDDGDIVSVFKDPDAPIKNAVLSQLTLALQLGGNKLDAFDTVLPKLYSAMGFRAVARMKWNEEHKPEGWDKELFKDFNNGEPDVVLMALDRGRQDLYQKGEGDYVTDWGDGVAKQKELLDAQSPVKLYQSDNMTGPAFEKWFGKSKVTNFQGEPLVVYHGTTHDFSTFEPERANIENDMGAGFYFSNTPEDIEHNYAGEGPDLTGRIERRAEQIDGEHDIGMDAAREQAREELSGGRPNTMPVYLSIKKPVVIGEGHLSETHFDYELPYNEKKDEYGEPKGSLAKIIEAIGPAMSGFDHGNKTPEDVIGSLTDKAIDNGGMSASDLIEFFKSENAFAYATDDMNGDLASNEIIRRIFEGAGYDGIIDNNPAKKFSTMKGVNPDTVHYIAFKPSQIKSIHNRGTWSGRSADILKQNERGSINFEEGLRKVTVAFTDRANRSTSGHEFSHFAVATHRYFASIARDKILNGEGTEEMQRLVDDWETLKKSIGATSDKFTVEQEEKVAKAFEDYLMKGDSPSESLRPIFAQFRSWLVGIYQDLKQRGVDVNPDIDKVFDRWLASEDETAKLRDKNSKIAQIAEALGIDGLAHKVGSYVNAAMAEAEGKLYKELEKEQKARESDAYKSEFDKLRPGVADEIKTRREYSLMDYMRQNAFKFLEGPETEGLPEDLLTSKVDEAVHPDDVASLYNYDTGMQMLRALKNAPDFDRAVDNEARSRLDDKYPDMVKSGRIQDKALSAIMNDKVLLALDLMVRELGKKTGKASKVSMKTFAKIIAQQQLETIKMKDVGQSFRYEVAREKSLREALQASRDGRPDEAMLHLQRAMVSQILYKGLEDFQDTKAKAEELFARVNQRDKSLAAGRDIDFVGAARYILNKFGLAREGFNINDWLASIEQEDPDLMTDLVGLAEMIKIDNKPGDELTIPEFLEVYDAVQNIFHIAKENKDFEVAGKRVKLDGVINELQLALDKRKKIELPAGTRLEGFKEAGKKDLTFFKNMLTKTELWTEQMDGGKDGPFKRYIWNPINKAQDDLIGDRRRYLKKLLAIEKRYKDIIGKKGKIETSMFKNDPTLGSKKLVFNSSNELLGFMLHAGNSSNLDKLLRGFGIDPGQYKQAMKEMGESGVITDKHWDYAQEVGDLLADLEPVTQRVFKKMFGYRYEKVDLAPFEVTTLDKDGATQQRAMRGWYYPASINTDLAWNDKAVEKMLDTAKTSTLLGSVAKGFTEKRIQSYAQPLTTDLRLASQHIEHVLRFIHIAPAAREVAKILRRKDFAKGLKDVEPRSMNGILIPWMQRFQKQVLEPPVENDADEANMRRKINYMRAAAITQILGYNIIIPMQDIANIPVAAHLIGDGKLGGGIFRIAGAFASNVMSPVKTARDIRAASLFMENRTGLELSKVEQALRRIERNKDDAPHKVADFMRLHQMLFFHASEAIIGRAIWKAAFNKGLETYAQDDAQAVEYANSIFRKTMGSARVTDFSKVEAQHPIFKAIAPLISFMNMQLNVQATEFTNIARKYGWKGSGKMFMAYMSLLAVPAFVSALMKGWMHGQLPNDDNHDGKQLDDWLRWMGVQQGEALIGEVPVVGPVVNTAINMAMGKPGSDRISLAPALSGIETAYRTGKNAVKAYKGDEKVNDGQLIQDLLYTLGFATNLPLGEAGKKANLAVTMKQGKAEPKNMMDFGKALVVGKIPKAK